MIYLVTILLPILGGIAVSVFLNDDRETDEQIKSRKMSLRNRIYTLLILLTDLLCVMVMVLKPKELNWNITDRAGICFSVDSFSVFSLSVILLLYTAVCFYSFEYMKKEERHEYFFAFFFISLGALIAVCFSATLVTMYAFFEIATLSSMPLILHEMNAESVAAGKKYLFYSIGGALMGLCAVLLVYSTSTHTVHFIYGGFMEPEMIAGRESLFLAAVFLGIVGFGTKAGIYPMHGWLPTAHPIAPAPASALMSGVIAKAGVIALVRLVYYSVGPSLLRGTWVQHAWMILAMITVLLGSTMAFLEPVLKKRLAYSTVSQISYILLGLSLLTDDGIRGALLQMCAHAASKGCLFLCAGVIIYLTGRREVKQLKGIGRVLPVTMFCFTICSLSLIGIPPMGGFLAKWQLACAALNAEKEGWAILPPVVLLISAMLTAGYLLPVVIGAFFPGRDFSQGDAQSQGRSRAKAQKQSMKPEKTQAGYTEPLWMTVPMLLLCVAALIVGCFGMKLVSWL